jgi:hypothetical protein
MIEQRSLVLCPFTLPVGSVGAAWAAGVAYASTAASAEMHDAGGVVDVSYRVWCT